MVHLPWTSVVPLVTFKGPTSEGVGSSCFAGPRGAEARCRQMTQWPEMGKWTECRRGA